MSLTAQQANQALANITTADQLRELVNQLSIEASGKTTILYSGPTALTSYSGNTRIVPLPIQIFN